jgi:hypothetical protein
MLYFGILKNNYEEDCYDEWPLELNEVFDSVKKKYFLVGRVGRSHFIPDYLIVIVFYERMSKQGNLGTR